VPITKIINRYSKSIANCCYVTKLADRTYIYDNSTDFEDPKLLFRVNNGNEIKKYHSINDWAKPIAAFIGSL